MSNKNSKIKFRAENLVRNASTNNIRLIVNTDRKARIIIIVNASIITLLISFTNFQVPAQILPEVPKVVLLLTNIVSLLFALRSVRLFQVTEKGADSGFDQKRYTGTTFDEFRKNMKAVLAKDERVVEFAILELYEQDLLLQKKYRYLGLAFRIFGIGMMIAILITVILKFLL
ncbi:MAG TPA: DUF5706 domain-containing protein [Cyclobacteriaceae bacterium]|nr:DUF5706 domain-containing protein [Cyclobacteriaceae bacterium]HRK53202.1 DUF5706 domain-containing protein [Cyclobacteriaceae bacterium]